MSKLIKLTTTLDKNRDTNGYLCIADNDILLPPNSKVSLLNAHLSSGILADYDINGTDSIGTVAQGEIIGNIQLADTNDRERDIIIPNGSYSINPLLAQLQKSMNDAIVYNSTSTYTKTTSQTLDVPETLDFGLACQTGLDAENKVSIGFNSTKQKYTADLKYSNKNNGVSIAPTGDISYTAPTGYVQFTLDQTKATRTSVYTNEEVGTAIGVFDVVNLVNTSTGASGTATVSAITLDITNITSAVALDTTKTDPVGLTVVSANPATTFAPFQVGQDITLDDGAGVAGTPSANTTYAKIQNVELILQNPNYQITEVAMEKIQYGAPRGKIESITPIVGQNNQFTMVVDVPFIAAAIEHYEDDGLFYVLDNPPALYAAAQINAVRAHIRPGQASSIEVDVVIEALDANPLEMSKMHYLMTAEILYSTTTNKTAQSTTAIGDGELGWFDKDNNLIAIFFQSKAPAIQQDLNTGDYYFQFEFIAGEIDCLQDDGTLLNGLPAFVKFIKKTYLLPGFDITTVNLTAVDRVITEQPADPATFQLADQDTGIIFEQGLVNQSAVKVSAAPSGFNIGASQYVVIPFEINPDEFALKAALFKLLIPATLSFYIIKNNVNQLIQFTLQNVSGTALSAVQTRIWPGTDIYNTYKIDLIIAPNSGINASNFDLLCKGTAAVGQVSALALEDSRLSPSCGRLAFKVVNVGPCEFGVMPEANNFNDISKGTADICIQIGGISGGGSSQNVYRLLRPNSKGVKQIIPGNSELYAETGDTVIIQYGVSPSSTDFEYNSTVNSGINDNVLKRDIAVLSNPAATNNYDSDRNKILISVLRAGKTTDYIYLGCVYANPILSNADQNRAAKCIPWTPRESPYVAPQYWNNKRSYRMYVVPNKATIRPLELTPSPLLITNSITGVISNFDGTNHVYHPDMHSSSNLELLEQSSTKFEAFNNQFIFTFSSQTFQKILGYKTISKAIAGLSGSWIADISYLRAYLPEGVVILLENLSIDTFDCGQFNGSRRNIIATCIDTQDKLGEISVEPSNLYRISIGNRDTINLRKFAVAFEDLYGNKLILQNAKVCVSLLFES